MSIEHEVRAEIEALHRFFTQWFRGEIERAALGPQLSDKLVDSFVNVQPAGQMLTRAELLEGIERGYGSNPAFEIEIRDVCLHCVRGDVLVATYIEIQRGARNTTSSENARRSTVVLERAPDGLRWVHVHETAIAL